MNQSLLPATEKTGATVELPEIDAGSPAPQTTQTAVTHLWNWLNRFEWLAVLVVGLVATALHVRFITHVGALWRDEANSVQLSTLPTFTEVWRFLDFDSFPILFFAVLRWWTGIFGPDNDAALRGLGLVIGLGVLAVLWLNIHSLGARLPVLSFALIGLNPMCIRYGDSTRAYGLGILLILLTFQSFWRLVESPSPTARRVLMATVLALLSVQCLYYNSVLLLAIAGAAIAVALRSRAWRTAGTVLAIGILAACSLLPYAPMMRRMHEWTFLVQSQIDLWWLWNRCREVLGSPDPLGIWLWTGLFAIGVILAATFGISDFSHWWRRRRTSAHDAVVDARSRLLPTSSSATSMPAAVLFAAVALVIGVLSYTGFLRVLSYYTEPWYYITLAAFVACSLDILFGAWSNDNKLSLLNFLVRCLRLGVALLVLCIAGLPAWNEMPIRHTNVDVVAAHIRSQTAKGDVVIVSQWLFAVSLNRYYHGPAEIVTLPPIEEYRIHRYDLVLRQMMTADPIDPVLARLERALHSGHRVFLVGAVPFRRFSPASLAVPPAYLDANGGWHLGPFNVVWPCQVGNFLRSHATRYTPIQTPGRKYTQTYENLDLSMVEGWR
jgi:hypothetical protein